MWICTSLLSYPSQSLHPVRLSSVHNTARQFSWPSQCCFCIWSTSAPICHHLKHVSHNTANIMVRGCADKSSAQLTSRCCRMESIVSLEWTVFSCANCNSILVKEAEGKLVRGSTRFQQHRDASCHQVPPPFPPARQDPPKNSLHSDRDIRWRWTIVCHRRNLGDPVKTWWFYTCFALRAGQLKTVTTPEIIEHIHEQIFADCRISANSIAEQPGFSRERTVSIIHEDFDRRKLSAKWIPKCLNADQKRQDCKSSEQHFELFFCRRDPNDFLSRFVTMNETWLYLYDPETKQQSIEWWHSGSPRSKISECKNSLEKSFPRFFGLRPHPPDWLSSTLA